MNEESPEITGIKIIEQLPLERWKEYRELRLRALKNEAKAFSSIYAENLKKPDEKWKENLKQALDGKIFMIFAEEDGQLLGMMGAFEKEDRVAQIFGVYVDKSVRGKGVGGKIFSTLLEQISGSDRFEIIRLTVNKQQTAAVALYEKYGFKIIGEEDDKMGDGEVYTELVMETLLR